jgi:hypothetical protein
MPKARKARRIRIITVTLMPMAAFASDPTSLVVENVESLRSTGGAAGGVTSGE